MENPTRKISLGFTHQYFEPGIHICQIFNEENERHDALLKFIISGLRSSENIACFSEKETDTTIANYLHNNGLSYSHVCNEGEFSLEKSKNFYFKENKFDPERMLKQLEFFYKKSLIQKRNGARVIGEMDPEIEKIPGRSRLMEYESRVSLLIRECPVTTVCQYDARSFNGSTIMDILKVHPYMIIRGSVVHNPFFIKPEDYLSSRS